MGISEHILELNMRALTEAVWPTVRPKLYQAIFQLLKKQAEDGEDWAQLAIGECYREGTFVPQNLKRAESIFIDHAKKKNFIAILHLISMYGDNDSPLFNMENQYIWSSIATIYDRRYGELKNRIIVVGEITKARRLVLDEQASIIFGEK
ncbi:hypothetical protein M7784_16060 [Desulfovibrio aminophilus]|nr:hypothetical protein [Desulfovibrio aminophilus]MCM0756749.1 hypothetical protein [Desulfovibrio aminophilus]